MNIEKSFREWFKRTSTDHYIQSLLDFNSIEVTWFELDYKLSTKKQLKSNNYFLRSIKH